MPPLRHYEHLLRLALVFVVGISGFAAARWLLVPAGYGVLGPYRVGAIALNEARPIAYAGQKACVECHTDIDDTRTGNAHARIGCESCHGPHAEHANDPAVAARRPDPRATCAVCHTPNAAKPAGFKSVAFDDHAGTATCTECHPAHAPRTW
jgi:hypothetical protein